MFDLFFFFFFSTLSFDLLMLDLDDALRERILPRFMERVVALLCEAPPSPSPCKPS